MGMFDYETDFNPAEPLWQRYSKQAEQQRQGLMRDVVDPFIEEKTGYVSPKVKMQRMASQTDLSDMNSVKNTFNTIMSHSPTAAAKWLKSVEPLIKSTIEQQKVAAQMMPKPKERKIQEDVHGRKRYVDTGKLVFPGVADKIEDEDEQRDLPQMNKAEKDRITQLVDSAFDFGFFDAWFTGQTDAPKGFSEKELVDFVFSYSQINNVPAVEVINGIKDKIIDPSQPISTVAPSSTNNNSAKVVKAKPAHTK